MLGYTKKPVAATPQKEILHPKPVRKPVDLRLPRLTIRMPSDILGKEETTETQEGLDNVS